jgi:hypothetical protein
MGCDVEIAIASITAPVAGSPEKDRLAGVFWPAIPFAVPNVLVCAAPLKDALPERVDVLADSVTVIVPPVVLGFPKAAPQISTRRARLLPRVLQFPTELPELLTPMAYRQEKVGLVPLQVTPVT